MNKKILHVAIASSVLMTTPLAVSAAAVSPYLAADDSWITLSGTVTSSTENSFKLDYGAGLVTVEMDDWNWFEEDGDVLPGDTVTVYGEVDDDLFETASIEASSVYFENLGTYFYASSADEESVEDIDMTPAAPIAVGDMVITGTVNSVTGREFTIDSGAQEMTVDTALMTYDPTDDEGYQQISEGDVVTVTGEIELDTFENSEIMADTVLTLEDDSDSQS